MKRVTYYLAVLLSTPILLLMFIVSLAGQCAEQIGSGVADLLSDMERDL